MGMVSIALFSLVIVLQSVPYVDSTYQMLPQRPEMMNFVFPSYFETLGIWCKKYSHYFCLLGYRTYQNFTLREPLDDDIARFNLLIRPSYYEVNFYSFEVDDFFNGGCCESQIEVYQQFGQEWGMSPNEFFLKIVDLRNKTEGRDLIYLKSYWDGTICMNVVSQVGYGRGIFHNVGGRGLSHNFTLPPIGPDGDEVITFKGSEVLQRLSYEWFSANVICPERPRHCRPEHYKLFDEAVNLPL